MNLFLAPLHSLFNLSFYRRVIQSSISRGFLYLLYLSFLATLVFAAFFSSRLLPEMDAFVEWTKSNMPVLKWTPEGLTMNKPSPYTMKHPELGALVTFDTSRPEVSSDAMGDVKVFVTSKKIYARQERTGELRVYDLTAQPQMQKKMGNKTLEVNAETVENLYHVARPIFFLLIFVLTLPFFFIWKLIAALFYSLIALFFNIFRAPTLEYSALLNVTFFAMTASILIQFLQLWIPIPLGLTGSLFVTSLYLFVAVKKTEDRNLNVIPPPNDFPPKDGSASG